MIKIVHLLLICLFSFVGCADKKQRSGFDGDIKVFITEKEKYISPDAFKYWTISQREGNEGLFVLDYRNKNYYRKFIIVDVKDRKDIKELNDSKTEFVKLSDYLMADSIITSEQIKEIYESFRSSNAISVGYREEDILFISFEEANLIYHYNSSDSISMLPSYSSFIKANARWSYILK